MFACHRAIRNVRGRSETQGDFDPTTSPENSGKTRLNHADPDLSERSDPCFDMAADWLFHNHPV
jgi:hypothetical protein